MSVDDEIRIVSAALSPDGARVLALTDDGCAVLLDAGGGGGDALLYRRPGARLQGAGIGADGRSVFAVRDDSIAILGDCDAWLAEHDCGGLLRKGVPLSAGAVTVLMNQEPYDLTVPPGPDLGGATGPSLRRWGWRADEYGAARGLARPNGAAGFAVVEILSSWVLMEAPGGRTRLIDRMPDDMPDNEDGLFAMSAAGLARMAFWDDLRVYAVATGAMIRHVPRQADGLCAALTDDGATIALGGHDGAVTVLGAGGATLHVFTVADGAVVDIALDRNGRRALWRTATGAIGLTDILGGGDMLPGAAGRIAALCVV